MVYYPKKTEQHAFKKIEKDIRNDNLNSPLFFYGREQYLIQWAISSIVKKYINNSVREMNYTKIDSSNLTVDDIINHCETLPILSDKRVVVIDNFIPLAGHKHKNLVDDDEVKLVDYFKQLPKSCILIMTETTADKRRKLYKTISDCGGCYEFKELDEKSLISFIGKRFKQSGKHAKPSLIRHLISMTGYYDKESNYTLYNLDNDLKKVLAYSRAEEIDIEDITNAVSGNIEINVFAMIDAISNNKKDEAFSLLHNLLSSGENVYKLLALISTQFETMLIVKEQKEEGYSFEEIKRDIGIHEYRIKKASTFANRYTVEQLRSALIHIYQVDKNIKYGILDSRLALELLIAQI